MRRAVVGVVVALLLGLLAVPSGAAADSDGSGTVHHGTYSSAVGVNPYLVYTPRGYRKSVAWPLYVMVHGCGTTAEQQMHANAINALADAERFVVLYPDTNAVNVNACWRSIHGDPTSTHRGYGGDADILAGLVLKAAAEYRVDRSRIYLMGMSSGAFQTSATIAAYPEVFAAAGVNAGGGYSMNWSCAAAPEQIVPLASRLALQEMGASARAVPFFSIGGDADPLGEQAPVGGCARLAFRQWMATDDVLLHARGDGLSPVRTTTSGKVPGGRAWVAEGYRTTRGCPIGERWVVAGMGHYWSGGSSDPRWAAFTDPTGPSAAVASWRFFEQFRRGAGCPR